MTLPQVFKLNHLIINGRGQEGASASEELDEKSDNNPEPVKKKSAADFDVDDSVSLYLKEISRIPLLSGKKEVELAKAIEQGENATERLSRNGIAHNDPHLYRTLKEDVELGQEVGYAAGGNKKMNDKTKLIYCTDGWLSAKILGDDPYLEKSGIDVVIVDEGADHAGD